MADDTRTEFRYQPRHGVFLNQHVWAILTKQPDGGWTIVNCLDKDKECFQHACAFTSDGGEWPFDATPIQTTQNP